MGARWDVWRLTGDEHGDRSTVGRWFDEMLRRSASWCNESCGVNRSGSESQRSAGDGADSALARGCEETTAVPTGASSTVLTANRQAHDWGWGSRPRPRTTSRVVTFILEIGSGSTLAVRTTSSWRASPSTSWSHKVLAPLNAQLACHPTRAHLRACPLQAWSKPSWTLWMQ